MTRARQAQTASVVSLQKAAQPRKRIRMVCGLVMCMARNRTDKRRLGYGEGALKSGR